MPKGFGYGGESANQEKKNLSKDMPVVKQASWMSKHSISGNSPVAMGGSYKGSAMKMEGGKGKAAKKETEAQDYPEKKVMSRSKYKSSDEDKAKFEQYKKKGGKLDIYSAYRVGFASPEESKKRLSSTGKSFQRGVVPRG